VHKQKQVLALAADQLSRDVGEILVPPLASLTPPHPRLAPTNYEPLMVPGTSALAYCEPVTTPPSTHDTHAQRPSESLVEISSHAVAHTVATLHTARHSVHGPWQQLTTRIEDTLAERTSVGVLAGARVERHLRVSTAPDPRRTAHIPDKTNTICQLVSHHARVTGPFQFPRTCLPKIRSTVLPARGRGRSRAGQRIGCRPSSERKSGQVRCMATMHFELRQASRVHEASRARAPRR